MLFEMETGGWVDFRDESAQCRFGAFTFKNDGLVDIRFRFSHEAG